MNWYFAAGIALIGLTIAIPIWAAFTVDEEQAVAAVPPAPECLDG